MVISGKSEAPAAMLNTTCVIKECKKNGYSMMSKCVCEININNGMTEEALCFISAEMSRLMQLKAIFVRKLSFIELIPASQI